MKKHIVITLLIFAAFDAAILWDVPSFKVLFNLLMFQLFAMFTGYQCGKWKQLIELSKEIDLLEAEHKNG